MSRLCVILACVAMVTGLVTALDSDCHDCHTRVTRSRNYYGPSPSQRFYKPPPNIYPIRGPFSYTPPPGYGADSGPPSYRAKVSKRHNPGLGEEDLHNIVKYLSKQDLDKIFELARKKGRYSDDSDDQGFGNTPSSFKESGPPFPSDDEFQSEKMLDGPYENYRPRPKGFEHDPNPNIYNEYAHQGPPKSHRLSPQIPIDDEMNPSPKGFIDGPNPNVYSKNKFLDQGPPGSNDYYSYLNPDDVKPRVKGYKDDQSPNIYNEYLDQGPPADKFYSQVSLDSNESKLHQNITPLDEYIDKIIVEDLPSTEDSGATKTSGEWKPQPMNDFEIAFTNKSPKIIKESSSYKLENFADLPLMNYDDSKLDTVNSYNVPHYTVTSHEQSPVNPFIQQTQSAGRDQSDAHLKAVRIWTHMSKGTAYTLHDDGSLSPERPNRPKF